MRHSYSHPQKTSCYLDAFMEQSHRFDNSVYSILQEGYIDDWSEITYPSEHVDDLRLPQAGIRLCPNLDFVKS